VNTVRKGDRFALEIKQAAEAKGLDTLKVRSSGHMGRRGGIPADLVIQGWRIEAKRYKAGIGSKACEEILTGDQGVHAVAHQSDRGMPMITLGLADFLDLLMPEGAGREKVKGG
jgi:hypothetical protein